MKKKIKLEIILVIIGLVLFSLSMLAFVINACTGQNLTLAWVLFPLIILGSGLILFGLILFLIHNKDRIKKYLDEITK